MSFEVNNAYQEAILTALLLSRVDIRIDWISGVETIEEQKRIVKIIKDEVAKVEFKGRLTDRVFDRMSEYRNYRSSLNKCMMLLM